MVFQTTGTVCMKKTVETTKLFLSVPDLKKQIKRSLFAIYSLYTLQKYVSMILSEHYFIIRIKCIMQI